jgi:hypothetical protein
MVMDAIYDRSGMAVAFLTGSRIVLPTGVSLAWVDGSGNVYGYDGRHLGWWGQGHMRGHDGGVVAWTRGATGLGLSPPPMKLAPAAPRLGPEPRRSARAPAPPRPVGDSHWSVGTLGADASVD